MGLLSWWLCIQDMITAGMDTTAISVEWAIAELVLNPDVQAKAQQELDQVRLVSIGICLHGLQI